ncbi:MAG: tRNA pseudouridine synthase A [Chitinophagales bacterium]|nr:tRNA pseudouridine synthase A [Chitinophagaceae bacterium]MCB9065684.1 tRNA pseudouridine synthase A [Chitinophagales bacterium]
MARYFLQIQYDGSAFHGSQIQGDTPTVQLAINQSLSTLLREPIESFGASRTDEGVHALCSYYHFDTEQPLHENFIYKMNAILPLQIAVNKLYRTVDPELNCRFAAVSRQYRYRIYKEKNPFKQNRALYHPYKIDRAILDETAEVIKEYTDFETFSKRNSQTKTYLCTIMESRWEDFEDELHYVVRGNRFLRGMVRGLVGTQLQAAKGKVSIEEFRKIIESKDCTQADFSVAGHGLYLEDIEYLEGSLIEIFDKN